MAAPAGLLQGTLDMLILQARWVDASHGFGIARWIERVTNNRLTVNEDVPGFRVGRLDPMKVLREGR